MLGPEVRTKRWTRVEYERLIDLGAFAPEDRVELIGGQLVVREPQGRPPVALDEESEPEPDIAVVTGGPRDYIESHPTHPDLVVEVALASLALDRGEKASLYARAGVADDSVAPLALPASAIPISDLLP